MGPDPTRAYFGPAVNKRPTCLWPGHFSTQRDFFWLERKKIETLSIFRGNFPNPNHKWLTRPTKNWPTRSQKFLTWVSLGQVSHLWFGFGFGKFPLKSQIFQFLPFGSKKISSYRVKKSRSRAGWPLIYCRSKVCSGWVRA